MSSFAKQRPVGRDEHNSASEYNPSRPINLEATGKNLWLFCFLSGDWKIVPQFLEKRFSLYCMRLFEGVLEVF